MAKKQRIDLGALQNELDNAEDKLREAVANKEWADSQYEQALTDRGAARIALRQASVEVTNS